MPGKGNFRYFDVDDFETTEPVELPPLAETETQTTEVVKVEPGEAVPFSLPHVSELDELKPRDARQERGRRLTLPSYNQIAPPSQKPGGVHQARTAGGPTVPPAPKATAALPPLLRRPLPTEARKRPHRRKGRRLPSGCVWGCVGLLFTFCGGLTLLTLGAALMFLPQVEAEWTARVAEVDNYRGFESSFIYDRHGNELYEAFGEGRRVRVSYDLIPQALIDATIAIEDDSFFNNIGIDVGATAVAALNYLGASNANTPGGSTITQQLVRNIFFDFEKRAQRSVARKLEEILLAIVLTQSKSKEDILEMYFNEIYYGNLAYGVQTAAQTFFGKDVAALSLGEAALLAGLPQAPANLDPLNPDPAVQAAVDARWRQVLGEMVEEAYISQAEVKEALQSGLSFVPANVSLTAPHFTVYAQGELERLLIGLGYSPEDITGGGLRVYTTLDQDVKRLAQRVAANQVAQLGAKNVSNAAVLISKPATGEIIAMIGSVDYNNEAIDGSVNVTTAFRQPGSTVKPFTYAAALERGMSPVDVLWDTRAEIALPGLPVYRPRNFDNAFHGPMTMRSALANSYNIPAVQTLRTIGVEALLSLLRRFGVSTLAEDASNYGLSLTLGGGEVTLIELTNAFAVFANQGDYVPVTSILCVIDSQDQILYQYAAGCPAYGQVTAQSAQRDAAGLRVLDPRIAFLITDMLGDNQARSPAMGAYSPLRVDNIFASVKTGTTDDVKDNWTIGYTRNIAIGVWVGNNDGAPMVDSSGLTGAAPIWNAVLTGIYGNMDLLGAFATDGRLQNDQPIPPSGLTLWQVCDVRRLTELSSACPATINEWALDGPAGVPDAAGNLHYPPVAAAYPTPLPTQGSIVQEVSQGVYQTLAYPLPPEIAASIQFTVAPGEKQPIPPNFCRVPIEHAPEAVAAGAQNLLFIGGPGTSQGDAVEAERYAREKGLAYLPTVDCWPGVYSLQSIGSVGAHLQIQQPANGQAVARVMPILGSAQFSPSQAEYYHMYIRGGRFTEWTPLGQPQRQPVLNGQLEMLHADALQPGNYVLRLALVHGGNIVQASDVVFNVPG